METASSPGCGELLWCSFVTLPSQPKLIGDGEEGAEEGGAIVVYQFDKSRLLDEATELDEMARAGPSVLYPLPCIGASTGGIEAVPLHG